MLLQCCLLDIDLILPEHATFCILMSMPKSISFFDLYFHYHFHFHCNLLYNLIKTVTFIHLEIFVKSSASSCCLAFA